MLCWQEGEKDKWCLWEEKRKKHTRGNGFASGRFELGRGRKSGKGVRDEMLEEKTQLWSELFEPSVCKGNFLIVLIHGGVWKKISEKVIVSGIEENGDLLF